MLSIATLRKGDAVQNADGTVGEVTGFTRDHVVIAWGPGSETAYTDADLKAAGVVRFGAK